MKFRPLGKTGLRVSEVSLGTWAFGSPSIYGAVDGGEATRTIRGALDAGINFFDTANVYAAGTSEEYTGRSLWKHADREDVVLATKVFNRMRPGPNGAGLSRKAILKEIDASLARLGTDYVDLYQIHRFDPETPVEETMEALHDVVKSGKARYLGASSMYAWQFAAMQHAAERNGWTRFVSMPNFVQAGSHSLSAALSHLSPSRSFSFCAIAMMYSPGYDSIVTVSPNSSRYRACTARPSFST
jgi:aryl-alcohol dehydrogenase-like predicted oxidoreductase